VGNSVCDRHCVFGHGRAGDLSQRASGDPVPPAPGDRGRCAWSGDSGVVLSIGAAVVRGTRSFWPYILGPGALAWAALSWGGFHPALALVPIVPFIPHAPRDLGLFYSGEDVEPYALNQFERWWARPVQFVLLLFGFANAGVPLAQIGPGTYYVLAALLLGKPAGILLFSTGARFVGARLPSGLTGRDLALVGIAASIGFTVSLFFATAAFPGGAALAETKMGALLSFAAAPLALLASRLMRRPDGRRPRERSGGDP
jgi:NhaA family Na+:H+ antiporter